MKVKSLYQILQDGDAYDKEKQRTRKWGDWLAHPKTFTVEFVPCSYEIPVDELNTNAQIIDWIFQLKTKDWASATAINDFLQFIEDVFDPQGCICSDGVDCGKIDAPKLFRDYFSGLDG